MLYCLSWHKVWTKVSWRKICNGRQTWRWRRRWQNWCFHPLLLLTLLLLTLLLRLKHCKGVVRTADAGDEEGLEADGTAQLDKICQQ